MSPSENLNQSNKDSTDSKSEKPKKSFDDMTAEEKEEEREKDKKKKINPLDQEDIDLLKTYGSGPYSVTLKTLQDDIDKLTGEINKKKGVKESETGLGPVSTWDLMGDKRMMGSEQPLQVARCTKIIKKDQNEGNQYLINIKQIAKYVVGLGEKVSETDIEEGMRVGIDRQNKYQIQLPLPPRIDASVSMMQVEEKPDITYNEVGGSKEQIEKIREVVEMPMLNPERFIQLGIDPPKGVLLYGRKFLPH